MVDVFDRKIFVGPAPTTLISEALVDYFSQFGDIAAVDQVDMPCVPSEVLRSLKATESSFVQFCFYIITFSQLDPKTYHGALLSEEWHTIHNHLVQIREVKSCYQDSEILSVKKWSQHISVPTPMSTITDITDEQNLHTSLGSHSITKEKLTDAFSWINRKKKLVESFVTKTHMEGKLSLTKSAIKNYKYSKAFENLSIDKLHPFKNIKEIFSSPRTIKVRVRSTDQIYQVEVDENELIAHLIIRLCQIANLTEPPDHHYLSFNEYTYEPDHSIEESGILGTQHISDKTLPELRLKYVHQLKKTADIGVSIVLASPEDVDLNEIFEIPTSPMQNDVMPDLLQSVAKQSRMHKSKLSTFSSKLIALPNSNKNVMDRLPTAYITISLNPNAFDWNQFLYNLALDLEVNVNEIVVMKVEQGSTKYEIKFKSSISMNQQKLANIEKKLSMIVLPTSKSAQFIAKQTMDGNIKEAPKLEVQLQNFSSDINSATYENLTAEEIDIALELMQRPAIVDQAAWQYLTEKSRTINASILHAFQKSQSEYVIENIILVYNEDLYHKHTMCGVQGDEIILFHGTKLSCLDGIFTENFKNLHTTDAGWYGQGIYFSNSPSYCSSYAGGSSSGIFYLICSLVKVGKVFEVTDMSYHGKPMRPDSDTHHVKVTPSGSPTTAADLYFEEFVIKRSEQILPLYIIGLRRINRFILWRDAKITNSENRAFFAQLKAHYSFNIYGCETSLEALHILKCKLAVPNVECIVVTNGGDNGGQFARDCRQIRPSLPIAVFCANVSYHQTWAQAISANGQPSILVANNTNEIFQFINTIFSSTQSHDTI